MLLDILCVDLVQSDGAPYWGAAAKDEDELVREDVRAEALDLLAAVGADETGRKLYCWKRRGAGCPWYDSD